MKNKDNDLIDEFLRHNQVTICDHESEYLVPQDYRRSTKTNLELYGKSIATFERTNKSIPIVSGLSLDFDSIENLSHLKPNDVFNLIGRSFTYKGEYVLIIDFDFFIKSRCVERYVLSNGVLVSFTVIKKYFKDLIYE